MENNTTTQLQSNNGIIQQGIQSQNEQGIRENPTHNGQPTYPDPSTAHQTMLDNDALTQSRERERAKAARIEAGNALHRKYVGTHTRDEQSINGFADFDESNTAVQPAEMYRYNNSEINKYGYF